MFRFRTTIFIFMAALSLGLINGCSDDDTSIVDDDFFSENDNFRVTIAGETLTSEVRYVFLTNPRDLYSITLNLFTDTFDHSLSITIFGDEAKEYAVTKDDPDAEAEVSYSRGPSGSLERDDYEGVSGTITVTKFDQDTGLMSGTFTVTVETEDGEQLVLSEGSFTDISDQF